MEFDNLTLDMCERLEMRNKITMPNVENSGVDSRFIANYIELEKM